jgi:hypothetical protein
MDPSLGILMMRMVAEVMDYLRGNNEHMLRIDQPQLDHIPQVGNPRSLKRNPQVQD